MLMASIFTMLIVPIANLDSVPAVFFFRFLTGFAHVNIDRFHFNLFFKCLFCVFQFKGFTLPVLSYMFVQWAPPEEKSTLVGFATAGTNIGTVISTLLGSYLCEYGFLEGWGSIFIIFG